MKKSFYILLCFFLAFSFSSRDMCGQNKPKPFFTVDGEVSKPLKLTWEDLLKLKQTEVKAKDKEGKEHSYKGVLLVAILDSAGVTLGKVLRGENLTKYVLIKAADGYKVIFSLPEIDPEFTDQTILLAYQVDGNPLPKGEGPFRIVVPNDKKPARWIRELTNIKIVFSKE
jgi:DMSO/TMAO reductase YedYZ molybdopterin-dependent catalytic subunit